MRALIQQSLWVQSDILAVGFVCWRDLRRTQVLGWLGARFFQLKVPASYLRSLHLLKASITGEGHKKLGSILRRLNSSTVMTLKIDLLPGVWLIKKTNAIHHYWYTGEVPHQPLLFLAASASKYDLHREDKIMSRKGENKLIHLISS